MVDSGRPTLSSPVADPAPPGSFEEIDLVVLSGKEVFLATAKESRRRKSKKRTPTILEQLLAGCEAERVAVHFLDGTVKEGALLYNAIKRSGKLINVEEEFSLDFDTHEVKCIKVLLARDPLMEAAAANG